MAQWRDINPYSMARILPAQEPLPLDLSSMPRPQNESEAASDPEEPAAGKAFIGPVLRPVQHPIGRWNWKSTLPQGDRLHFMNTDLGIFK